MRRYVLGDAQSEDGVINDKGMMGDIFYGHTVVGNNTYSIYTKMGATIPVLKNEIEDFFFARLGTGRTYHCSLRHNVCRPATDAYTDTNNNKKRTGDYRFPYFHTNLRGIFDEKRLDEIF